MLGFRYSPLIPWLVLAGLGFVFGLGEDLDRPLFGPPGSLIRLHESDPGLKKALEFAEERYNRGSNAMHLRKVSRFISATRQVPRTLGCAISRPFVNSIFSVLFFAEHCVIWARNVTDGYSSSAMRRWFVNTIRYLPAAFKTASS